MKALIGKCKGITESKNLKRQKERKHAFARKQKFTMLIIIPNNMHGNVFSTQNSIKK
jgi:hypothetical protein